MSRGNEWYARRTHERTVKPGDRIAVLGRAIALVEQVSAGHVRAKLWNKTVLMIGRKCIRWDEQRDRRISVGHASVNQLSGAIMSQDGGGSEERIAALLTRMSMPPRCASSGWRLNPRSMRSFRDLALFATGMTLIRANSRRLRKPNGTKSSPSI